MFWKMQLPANHEGGDFMSHPLDPISMSEAENLNPMALRKVKGRGGFGMHRNPGFPEKGLKSDSKLKKVGDTKRGNEERVLKFMRELIIQEVHESTDIPVKALRKYELDHIKGRNATGYEPFGAILSPLNLQLLPREQHEAKTNALTPEGQRMDYRVTAVQERMIDLNRRLIRKVGKIWNLKDLKRAIEAEIFTRGDEE